MTDTTSAHWYNNIPRSIYSAINQGIYFLLGAVYNILISISNVELFTDESFMNFVTRIQLIIGVFMVFRLTITILQGIINPDKFTDSKTGVSNIVVRMITSLALLTMLVPINIPKAESDMNSYEKYISRNGLLFGILYDFQNRIVTQNVLGKLVLGSNNDIATEIKDAGDGMAADVLKAFFTPNLKDDNFELDNQGRYKEKDLFCEDYNYNTYYATQSTSKILGKISEYCDLKKVGDEGDYEGYAYNFSWFISLIVGILFLVVLVFVCIEVAKRAIKLAILRLISPIPIISYMDPKSSEGNGAFSSWVKTLSSTYLDLFLHLIVIYFVIFLIKEMTTNGISYGSGSVGIFTKIFIWIGLLLFAKDAPKFIKQALGIKDDGGKGWFSGIAAAAGLGAAGLGAVGAMRTNWNASKKENNEKHPGHSVANFGRNVGSALIGGMSGMATGAKAAVTAKDHNFRAATDAMQARNDRRAAGYTPLRNISGRLKNTLGANSVAKYDDQIKDQKAFFDYYDHAMKKADVDDTQLSSLGFEGYGNESVKSLKEAFERTKIAGASQAEQKAAEDRYKEAQAKLVGAVIKGKHKNGQAEQIKLDYDMAKDISKKYEGTKYALELPKDDQLRGLTEEAISGQWKGTHFTASDNAYKIEQSDEYARAKLNDQISKK